MRISNEWQLQISETAILKGNEQEAAGVGDTTVDCRLLSQWKEMLDFKYSFVKIKDVIFHLNSIHRPRVRTSVISPTALEWQAKITEWLRGLPDQSPLLGLFFTLSLDLAPLTCLQIVGFFLSLPHLSDSILVPKLSPCAPSSFLTWNPHLSAQWTRSYLGTNGVDRHHCRSYAT